MIKGKQPENIRLGAVIRRRRLRLHLSQEQFSELVPCHPTYVGNVERGEFNISVATLLRFARALKTTVRSLVTSARI